MRITLLFMLICSALSAQVPILQSLPTSQNVLYLDFDGAVVNNPNWSATTINAAPSGFTSAQITECFNIIANHYTIFDLNVTTSLAVYNAALATKKQRIVFTPTSEWYGGVGGVAFISSWGWQAYEPGWVFTANLTSGDMKTMANAAVHEAGHQLHLSHHAQYNSSNQPQGSYHFGKGTGETSWCPMMGVGYSSNVVQWVAGPVGGPCGYRISGGFNMPNWQDDFAEMTLERLGGDGFTSHPKAISFKADDIGNTTATAKAINIVNNAISDSGLIIHNYGSLTSFKYATLPAITYDDDYFRITTTAAQNMTINCRPWSLSKSTSDNQYATLDVRLIIRNAAGTIIAIDSNINKLNATISLLNQPAGTYFIQVSASGNPNYTDFCYSTNPIGNIPANTRYGSVGRYYLTGTFASATSLPVANFTQPSSTCVGNTLTMNNQSQQATTYTWNFGAGATPSTSTAFNPTVTYTTAGSKTITLTATNTNGSNTTTRTVNITSALNATIQAPASVVSGTSTVITANATGGTTPYTYNWYTVNPNQTTQSITIAPTTATGYNVLVTSANGCTSDAYAYVNVGAPPPPPPSCPQPTISATTTCNGTTLNITPNTAYQSFLVQHSVNNGSINSQTITGTSASFNFQANASVRFIVTATCTNGAKSTASEITSVIPAITQAAPDFSLASSNGRITTTFVNNGSKFYAIRYRANGTTAWTENTTNGLTITVGAVRGTTYEVQSQSRCQTGQGSWSTSKTITAQ